MIIENIGVVVVFFAPTAEQILKWKLIFKSLSSNFVRVVVWNSPPTFESGICLDFVANNENVGGLRGAYFVAIQECKRRSLRYIYLCDQDSEFSVEYFSNVFDAFQKFQNCNVYSACGTALEPATRQRIAPAIKDRSLSQTFAQFPINSGTLLDLTKTRYEATFDSSLHLDYLDTELWFRMTKLGMRCVWVKDEVFLHSIGSQYRVFGRSFSLDSMARYRRRWQELTSLVKAKKVPRIWAVREASKILLKQLLIFYRSKYRGPLA